MRSSMPPASPASIMLTKSWSKIFGWRDIAAASVEPSSTSWRVCVKTIAKCLVSCCCASISRHWTSGNPASIITENWRVKMANSLALTFLRPPPSFGTAISRPFSLTEVSMTCSRRSSWRSTSRLSARRSPTITSPSSSAFEERCMAIDGDDALVVERGERLVERLHAVLALAGLHHRVNLVHLVLADEVAYGRVGHENLQRHDATAPVSAGQKRLAEYALQDHRELRAYLRLLAGGEDVNDAVDGGRRGVCVKGREGEVAG